MQKWVFGLRIATGLATLAVLALLCWQCIDIYVAGNRPENLDENGVHLTSVYTVDKVAQRLKPLTPVFAGYGLLVIAALAVQAASAPAASRMTLTPENRLRLVKARVAEMPQAALKEERSRRWLRLIAGAAVLVCAVCSLVYLLDGRNFTDWELEGVMGRMLLHVAPWVVMAFAVLIAASLACARSMEKELEALRDAPRCEKQAATEGRRLPVNGLRVVLYAVAAVFIVLGVMNGGLYDVLVKAINICTECIGLG